MTASLDNSSLVLVDSGATDIGPLSVVQADSLQLELGGPIWMSLEWQCRALTGPRLVPRIGPLPAGSS